MSVESTDGKIDCTNGGLTSQNRFRGVRVWDISDPANPRRVDKVTDAIRLGIAPSPSLEDLKMGLPIA